MFTKIMTEKYKSVCSEQIHELKAAIKDSDTILIGAGAGLSTSAGFVYDGERFKQHFADFEEKYGFHNMYEGGFYPYESLEEYWAYWSRYIFINRYMDPLKQVYEQLLELVKEKDYFVLTTNVDHCFQKAGFDKQRLFYMQGDFGLFQCSVPCCKKTYDNEDIIRQMVERQQNMRIPSDLLPICPNCGEPLTTNLRSDDTFVEDKGWHQAAKRYQDFLRIHQNQKILFLELGVGNNTPIIIKYPFWQMTAENPNAIYACVNFRDSTVPSEMKGQSICIDDDIAEVINKMLFR